MHRAVFVDRDGVICRNRRDHVKSWEEFVFLPGALDALRRLAQLDLYIVIITNQAIVNRRIVPRATVEDIHRRMVKAIEEGGGHVDQVVFCPHRPDEDCGCRKPQPGMLLQAARDLGIDLMSSYLIGDAFSDMEAGRAVGCDCYMVLTGRGLRQTLRSWTRGRGGFTVKLNLPAAVNAIYRCESSAVERLPGVLEWGNIDQ